MAKKIRVLTLSKVFLSDHPRKGEPTGFGEKFMNGEKGHTLRANYEYWKKIIDEVRAGEAVLSVRQWQGKPYFSTNKPALQDLEKVNIDEVQIEQLHNVGTTIDHFVVKIGSTAIDSDRNGFIKTLAENDGLSVDDFLAWFKLRAGAKWSGCVIYFGDKKY